MALALLAALAVGCATAPAQPSRYLNADGTFRINGLGGGSSRAVDMRALHTPAVPTVEVAQPAISTEYEPGRRGLTVPARATAAQ